MKVHRWQEMRGRGQMKQWLPGGHQTWGLRLYGWCFKPLCMRTHSLFLYLALLLFQKQKNKWKIPWKWFSIQDVINSVSSAFHHASKTLTEYLFCTVILWQCSSELVMSFTLINKPTQWQYWKRLAARLEMEAFSQQNSCILPAEHLKSIETRRKRQYWCLIVQAASTGT